MVSDLNIYVLKWSKIAAQEKVCFFADFALQHGGHHTFRWIRDLWSMGLLLILAYL